MSHHQHGLHQTAASEPRAEERIRGKRRMALQLIARGKRLRSLVRLVIASAIALVGYELWLFALAVLYQPDFAGLM